MDDANAPENGKKEEAKPKCEAPNGDFRIRDFPDLRRLRKNYIKKGDRPVGVDSNDTPRPEDEEEDFGLNRSTPEEAWEFYRKTLEEKREDDPLTEFLDDQ